MTIVTQHSQNKVKRKPTKGDRYRHYDEHGNILNGGRGKPRPSAQLPEDERKDYQFGGRVPNALGRRLDAIMAQTGENKSQLMERILLKILPQLEADPKLKSGMD